jgi:hypothetical protein
MSGKSRRADFQGDGGRGSGSVGRRPHGNRAALVYSAGFPAFHLPMFCLGFSLMRCNASIFVLPGWDTSVLSDRVHLPAAWRSTSNQQPAMTAESVVSRAIFIERIVDRNWGI